MISSGSATWRGSWHDGDGTISTSGETIQNLPFSYASRFEGKPGGNPEELFATAYAGCLTQALANTLDWGNWVIEKIETTVQVELEMGERSPNFKGVHVIVRAKVPMIKEDQSHGLANAAKNGCLISRLQKIDVSMDATIDSSEPIRIAHIAG